MKLRNRLLRGGRLGGYRLEFLHGLNQLDQFLRIRWVNSGPGRGIYGLEFLNELDQLHQLLRIRRDRF
jgi:hypothetical protein